MKPSRRGRENSLPARAGSQCEEPGMQATIVSTDAELVPFWSAPIRDRRIPPALGLGFTSGMPFLLTYSTQSAWLTDAGVPLATIGLLSELTLAYKFKFVWAPFLDQYDPPLIGRVLGRRRGWLLVAILAVMAIGSGGRSDSPSRSGSRAQRSISCSTAGASRVYARRRNRRCCPHGPRSAGASAISRPAQARSTSPIISVGRAPICAWRP